MTSFLSQMWLEDLCLSLPTQNILWFHKSLCGDHHLCCLFCSLPDSFFFYFLYFGKETSAKPRAKRTPNGFWAFQGSRGKAIHECQAGRGIAAAHLHSPSRPQRHVPYFAVFQTSCRSGGGNKPLLSQQPAAVPSSTPTPLAGPGTRNRPVFIQAWPFAPLPARIWVEREQRKPKSGAWEAAWARGAAVKRADIQWGIMRAHTGHSAAFAEGEMGTAQRIRELLSANPFGWGFLVFFWFCFFACLFFSQQE